nr:MAG TPA: hypothetical protein [Caudoviricetes sp.]
MPHVKAHCPFGNTFTFLLKQFSNFRCSIDLL